MTGYDGSGRCGRAVRRHLSGLSGQRQGAIVTVLTRKHGEHGGFGAEGSAGRPRLCTRGGADPLGKRSTKKLSTEPSSGANTEPPARSH